MATARGLAVATYLAVLTTALAYLLYARGLRTTAVTTATTLGLAEPAVAAVLGLAVLGEHLTINRVRWPWGPRRRPGHRGLARAAPHGRRHI